jgi:hypothetical protein
MTSRINLDLQDAACHQIVHIMQHPTARPTTKSMQSTMAKAQEMHITPLRASEYGHSTMRISQLHHQMKKGNSAFQQERVRTHAALRRLQAKEKLMAEKQQETHFLSNAETEQ